MLDTDACIRFMNRTHPQLTERIVAAPAADYCISVITAAELTSGAERSARAEKSREKLKSFRASIATMPFDESAIAAYGKARASLSRGMPIGPLDLLIGAHAQSLDLVLITGNIREFGRLKGLRVEDWSR